MYFLCFNLVLAVLLLDCLSQCDSKVANHGLAAIDEDTLKRSRRAPGDLIFVSPMLDEMKKGILDIHNRLRRSVKPPASNMRLLTWDYKLEESAKNHSSKCLFEHRPPSARHNEDFDAVGENINRGAVPPASAGTHSTQSWFNEVKDYTYSTRSCAPSKVCGHYTQVVWATTVKVGCGISFCKNLIGRADGYLTICHYGRSGNVVSFVDGKVKQPYTEGKGCSNCLPEDTKCDNGLCTKPASGNNNNNNNNNDNNNNDNNNNNNNNKVTATTQTNKQLNNNNNNKYNNNYNYNNNNNDKELNINAIQENTTRQDNTNKKNATASFQANELLLLLMYFLAALMLLLSQF